MVKAEVAVNVKNLDGAAINNNSYSELGRPNYIGGVLSWARTSQGNDEGGQCRQQSTSLSTIHCYNSFNRLGIQPSA